MNIENDIKIKEELIGRKLTYDEFRKTQDYNNLKKIGMTEEIKKKLQNDKGSNKKVGKIYVSLRGDKCRSICDLLLANFFYINKIKYDYDKLIVQSNNFKYDFKVKNREGNNIYIEIWGDEEGKFLKGYKKRITEKKIVYENNELMLLELHAKKIHNKAYITLYKEFVEMCIQNKIKINRFKKYNEIEFIKGSEYDFNNFAKELMEVIKNNKIPSSNELRQMGKTYLEANITKFGGAYEVAKRLGLDLEGVRRQRTEENIKEEFLNFIKQIQRIPSERDYKNNKKLGLCGAIKKFKLKDKLIEIAKQLGYKHYNDNITFWEKDEEKILKELEPLIKKYGYIPSRTQLKQSGRGDLSKAIDRIGGTKKIKEITGAKNYNQCNNRRELGTWDREGNKLKEVLTPVCHRYGYIPSPNQLKEIGLGYIENQITLYGGRNKLALKVGYPTYSMAKGRKNNAKEYVLEVNNIM